MMMSVMRLVSVEKSILMKHGFLLGSDEFRLSLHMFLLAESWLFLLGCRCNCRLSSTP